MTLLPLPKDPTNTVKLADWLEIYALLSSDENSSSGDLEAALRSASAFEGEVPPADGDDEDEDELTDADDTSSTDSVEEGVLAAFAELDQRASACGAAYPFDIGGGVVSVRAGMRFSPYVYFLCVSYFGYNTKLNSIAPLNPWLLFEDLCCLAAAQYVQGPVVKFGAGSRDAKDAKRTFKNAVNHLCEQIGEGMAFRPQDIFDTKDSKVDLVAWRGFEDGWPSKIVMFGQCAAGKGWLAKDSELDPIAFWDQWMIEPKISPFLRSFFLPHRIFRRDEFVLRARRTGILFDRCRISHLVALHADAHAYDVEIEQYVTWCLSYMPDRGEAAGAEGPSAKTKKKPASGGSSSRKAKAAAPKSKPKAAAAKPRRATAGWYADLRI